MKSQAIGDRIEGPLIVESLLFDFGVEFVIIDFSFPWPRFVRVGKSMLEGA